MYETGQHEAGRAWLDHWVAESGRAASHRAHFSWHAALHELALGDTEAVRQRYYTQLAPPTVTGVRALIDSASLLWRWSVTTSDWDAAAGTAALHRRGGAAAGRLRARRGRRRPRRPTGDAVRRAARGARARRRRRPAAAGPAARRTAQGSADADGAHDRRAGVRRAARRRRAATGARPPRLLADVLPGLPRVGGSAAQREIVEETLLFCLVSDGQAERALALLDGRLDRRTLPLDPRRRASLGAGSARTLDGSSA